MKSNLKNNNYRDRIRAPLDVANGLPDAHSADDRHALVELHTEAADTADTVNAMCFYLAHAYVFALEVDHATQGILQLGLVAQGREE